jgi:hypothetical protein
MFILLLALTATPNPQAARNPQVTPAAVCPVIEGGRDAERRMTTEREPQSCCGGCETTATGDSAPNSGKVTPPKPAARIAPKPAAPTFTTYLD